MRREEYQTNGSRMLVYNVLECRFALFRSLNEIPYVKIGACVHDYIWSAWHKSGFDERINSHSGRSNLLVKRSMGKNNRHRKGGRGSLEVVEDTLVVLMVALNVRLEENRGFFVPLETSVEV